MFPAQVWIQRRYSVRYKVYTAYTADSHTGKYTAPPYLHLALGHRWPWDQVGGARVDRGTVALRCLGCLPTITSNISGVKDAQRSRRQSIWAVYASSRLGSDIKSQSKGRKRTLLSVYHDPLALTEVAPIQSHQSSEFREIAMQIANSFSRAVSQPYGQVSRP